MSSYSHNPVTMTNIATPSHKRTRLAIPLTLTLALPENIDPAVAPSMGKALRAAASMAFVGGQNRILQDADRLAAFVEGAMEPSTELIEERLRRLQTIRRLLEDGDWLTAEQINALQPNPPPNKSQPANDWKRRGRIFSVSHGGRDYFARYQFDAVYEPLPVVKPILEALGRGRDPWAVAAWFHFPNGWIARESDGALKPVAPKDALDRADEVIAAAHRHSTSYVA